MTSDYLPLELQVAATVRLKIYKNAEEPDLERLNFLNLSNIYLHFFSRLVDKYRIP